MRKLMILLFLIGTLWFSYKEIEYGGRRYFSEWISFAAKLPKENKIDRELSVKILRELNLVLHKNHKSYSLPCLLMIVSGIGLIFSQQTTEKNTSTMRKARGKRIEKELTRRMQGKGIDVEEE